MLIILTTLLGILGPLLPEVIKLFRAKQDAAHELAMLQMQIEAQKVTGSLRLEEMNQQAAINETMLVHQPQASFGVQMLDAAKNSNLGGWALVPAFYLFTILDWIAGMVRPTITYAVVGFYMLVKWSMFRGALTYSETTPQAIVSVWGEQDWAVLTLTLSYYFGGRIAKSYFGGSSMNDKRQ